MYNQFNDKEECDFEIIRSLLIVLLYELRCMFYGNKLRTIAKSRAEEISHEFELLIKKTFRKKRKLSWYASELCISTTYLRECVKKTTGKPPKKVLDKYLILEAQSMLLVQENTIELISEILGFDEASNFINFFKNNTKMTPGSYRSTLANHVRE